MAAQAPNLEQFEAYFQRADTDRDGRISGNEAVAFFQATNLAKQVLAQVPLLFFNYFPLFLIAIYYFNKPIIHLCDWSYLNHVKQDTD